jgi:uncharacterized protein (TIGR02145 family)
LTFQCHNLGADDLYPGMTIDRRHHGDWYRFGAPIASMYNTVAHDSNNSWDNLYVQSTGDWPTGSDPCPAGYRLPTSGEWQQVINNNSISDVGVYQYSELNFGAGKKFGDYLVLPAAGFRGGNGALTARGNIGYYWSSTSSTITNGYSYLLYFGKIDSNIGYSGTGTIVTGNASSGYGMSVRCVSE